MSSENKVKPTLRKGISFSFLGSLLFIPLGLMPKVFYIFYFLPGVLLNALQENLSIEYKYFPGIVIAGLSYFVFGSAFASGLVLFSMVVLGLFNLFNKSGKSLFKSGLYAITPVSIFLIFIARTLLTDSGLKSSQMIHYFKWELLQLKLPETLQITEVIRESIMSEIALYYPATIIIFGLLLVFLSLIFERAINKKLFNKDIARENLTYFKAPDYFIWVFLVSVAFGFVNHDIVAVKYIAQNISFICFAVYYFQGFAVLFNFFDVFKVGAISKALMIFCLAFSLFHVTAIMGVLDYWYNFRARFLKRATQVNERRN